MPFILTILYPRPAEDGKFDLDYYLNKHMPMCGKFWYPRGLQRWHVEQIPQGEYGIKTHCEWESQEAFGAAAQVESELKEIMGDVSNYTTVTPVQLFGQVVGSGEKPKL